MNKLLIAAVLSASLTGLANAGVYTNELAKCLVSSTTQDDRAALVRWMFIAASHHPAVADIANVSAAQVNEGNKQTGLLFTKLMTETCKEQTKNAIAYEGQLAIQGGFQVLGQVAGQELFSSPAVAAAMAGIQQHVDNEKLEAVLTPTPTQPAN
ncbi:hypothetical protein K0504_16500 [Neiella marina]|uniref:Uncharacterized protein n=1 Tax=Neiella holothuriorum TaxID=2870530 RepID=A0ABS7EJZ0_9GAMM|nr:hypothetical protein [Neiella holothuriorum]MBW8192640.1 hypothetical protein [Neiella holothuriorum]